MDEQQLQKELDRCKSQVFLGSNAAFLGSLLCSMTFHWDESVGTAATDGVNLWWNPIWFASLLPETRKTILVHELWHPGRLHMVRAGSRNHEIWNNACDIAINNMLEDEGYSFVGIEWGWRDQSYSGWAEEDIYDDLVKTNKKPPMPPPMMEEGDIRQPSKEQVQQITNNVVRAVHQAVLAKQEGNLPGNIKNIIDKFLTPVIDWKVALNEFFSDLLDEDYSWKKPNRRHQDIYLPSRVLDDSRLEHLTYYLDVSGSITSKQILRFNSEVSYVKAAFNPQKLTLVQFDTQIRQVDVFEENDVFDKIEVFSGGGTSLVCVREHIQRTQPTAAIIFSDLQVHPMKKLDYDIPVIWIGINCAGMKVPFGKLINITE